MQPLVKIEDGHQVYEEILKILKSKNIKYRSWIHDPTKTSEESAAVRGVNVSSGAKAMLIKLSTSPVTYKLIVLSASKKISWKAVKNVLKIKKVELASEEDVKSITKCLSGAVPPFGSLWEGVETLIDRSLLLQGDTINFNAGLRTHSLGLDLKDYLSIENGQIVDVSE